MRQILTLDYDHNYYDHNYDLRNYDLRNYDLLNYDLLNYSQRPLSPMLKLTSRPNAFH